MRDWPEKMACISKEQKVVMSRIEWPHLSWLSTSIDEDSDCVWRTCSEGSYSVGSSDICVRVKTSEYVLHIYLFASYIYIYICLPSASTCENEGICLVFFFSLWSLAEGAVSPLKNIFKDLVTSGVLGGGKWNIWGRN